MFDECSGCVALRSTSAISTRVACRRFKNMRSYLNLNKSIVGSRYDALANRLSLSASASRRSRIFSGNISPNSLLCHKSRQCFGMLLTCLKLFLFPFTRVKLQSIAKWKCSDIILQPSFKVRRFDRIPINCITQDATHFFDKPS